MVQDYFEVIEAALLSTLPAESEVIRVLSTQTSDYYLNLAEKAIHQDKTVTLGLQFCLAIANVGGENICADEFGGILERALKKMMVSFCSTFENHKTLYEECFKIYKKTAAERKRGDDGDQEGRRKRKRN